MKGRNGIKVFDKKNINLFQGVSVYGDTHIVFSFTSHESLVKQIIRELLWGGVISNAKYEPEEEPYSSKKVTYFVYIENNNFDDLVNMFWYKNEIIKRLSPGMQRVKRNEEDSYLVVFRKVKVNVKYRKNEEWITAPVAQLLQDAYLAAENMQDTELVINKKIKPDDLSLWTEQELLENEEMVRELENKSQSDKLYVSKSHSSSAEPSSIRLERGINEMDEEGKTYLQAVFSNQEFIGAVKFLLDKGADVNQADSEGNTPLHFAIKQYQEVITLLLTHGANPQIENQCGVKPMDLLSDWMEKKNIEIKERMQKNPFKFWHELEKECNKSHLNSSSERGMSVEKRMGK